MSVTFLATSVTSEPENFAGISGFYPIDRTSVGVLVHSNLCQVTLETGISSGALFAPKLYYFLTKVRSLCFILIENMKNVVEYGRF